MPSRFEQRFQTLAVPRFNRNFGVTVRLSQGIHVTDEFTARRNDREYKAIDSGSGIEIRITMRDFILPAASLVIDGYQVEPETGNRIYEGDEIFEIQPPNENTPSAELQAGGYEWLVHTKRIE